MMIAVLFHPCVVWNDKTAGAAARPGTCAGWVTKGDKPTRRVTMVRADVQYGSCAAHRLTWQNGMVSLADLVSIPMTPCRRGYLQVCVASTVYTKCG